MNNKQNISEINDVNYYKNDSFTYCLEAAVKSKKNVSFIDCNFCQKLGIKKQYNYLIIFRTDLGSFLFFREEKVIFKFNQVEPEKNKYLILPYYPEKLEEIQLTETNNLKKIILLYYQEKEINNLVKGKISTQPKEYFLINSDWINTFKKSFKFLKIVDDIKKNKLTNNIKTYEECKNNLKQIIEQLQYITREINKLKFPEDLLSLQLLKPKEQTEEKTEKIIYLINFSILSKDFFYLLTKEFKREDNLIIKNYMLPDKVFFGENKIFIIEKN